MNEQTNNFESNFGPRTPAGPGPILPEDLRVLSSALEQIARLERDAADLSIESEVFSASIEHIAGAVPRDLEGIQRGVEMLASQDRGMGSGAEGLEAMILAATQPMLEKKAGVAGRLSGGGARHGVENRANPTAWKHIRASRSVRIAASLTLLATVLGVLVVGRMNKETRQDVAALDAQREELLARVDASMDDLWGSMQVASEDGESAEDTYSLDEYLTDTENSL